MDDFSWWWLGYPLLGIIVGFMAGLLGVGGGLITVPVLLFLNQAQKFPSEHLYKMVLASSMAAMVFTSFSSVKSHYQQGHIDWSIVKSLTPGLLLGAGVGGFFGTWIPDFWLAMVFISFALYTSLQMFFNWKVSPHRALPNAPIMVGFGLITGVLSALISAGGGFLVVPFLSWCNVDMKRAVAVSAGCGFPIAFFGAIGYMLSGWNVQGLPPHSLGWVHLPSALGIAMTSVFFARIGAKVSSSLPVSTLKKIFALLLLGIAVSIAKRYISLPI